MKTPYLLFWDWTPTPSYPTSLACLSQWYPLSFTDPTHPTCTFKTTEHYMMYSKALLFDPSLAPQILAAETPAEAKALGRQVRNFDRKRWNEVADEIVERGNYQKFREAGVYWGYLRDTSGKVLVECNPDDRIWGIGYSIEDAMDHVDDWGTNRMGFALTRARDRLLAEESDSR